MDCTYALPHWGSVGLQLGFEAGIPLPGIPRNSRSENSGNEPFVDTGIPDSRIGIPGMSVLARTWNGPN